MAILNLSCANFAGQAQRPTGQARALRAGRHRALDLWVEMAHYCEVNHKTSDTIDKVDTHNLTAGEAIVAITAYAIAETTKPIAVHIVTVRLVRY